MTDTPLVSVVIAVKNAEATLARALDSVAAQTYPHFEILVVDGNSTDATERVARGYPAVRFSQQTGQGLSDAWNCGIEAARGALIVFLDSDDWYAPDKLRLQVEALRRDPALDYVDGMVRFYVEPGQAIPPAFNPEQLERPRIGYMPGTLMLRREVFAAIGLFDPALAFAGDTDWLARAKDRGVRRGELHALVLHKCVRGASLSLHPAHGALLGHELLTALHRSLARRRGKGGA